MALAIMLLSSAVLLEAHQPPEPTLTFGTTIRIAEAYSVSPGADNGDGCLAVGYPPPPPAAAPPPPPPPPPLTLSLFLFSVTRHSRLGGGAAAVGEQYCGVQGCVRCV